MEQARHKRLYALHEWSGLVCGVFLFMVSFTGTVAMFYDEFRFWETVELREVAFTGTPVAPDPLIERHLASYPESTTFENLFLSLPTEHGGYYALFGQAVMPAVGEEPAAREPIEVHWHAGTGERLDDRGHGLSHWLRDIHRDLMLPNRTIGRFLVGVAGLVMLVSIVSGIFTHQKILKELFTLRVGRSKRLQWKDAHNALGAWALPFHAMIAFSGAYLGLVVILLPIFAFGAFKGDQAAAIEAVIGKTPEAAGVAAPAYPIAKVVAAAEADSGYQATSVRLLHYGDANARYEAFVTVDDRLKISDSLSYSGTTGEAVANLGPAARDSTVPEIILNALVALHYATYGGIWLKVLYIGLGGVLCVMIGTGLMVWVERRANGPVGRHSPASYALMGRFNTGAMLGLPLATVALFYIDRLVPVAAADRLTLIGTSYLGIWAVCALLTCFIRDARLSFCALLAAAGALGVGVLPLDAATLGNGATLLDASQRNALGLDLGLMLLGALAIVVAKGLYPKPAVASTSTGGAFTRAVPQAPKRD
ncbi:MAG: PepSY-associated TM helix domain-containing protein [Pseudomonadota bacterium]